MGNYPSRHTDEAASPPPVTGIPVTTVAAATGIPVATTERTTTATEDNTAVRKLDVCFTMDCTGSMGQYIRAAKESIRSIATRLAEAEGYDVRFGIVAYRDHPPQDMTFVTRSFAFSAQVSRVRAHLETLSAEGGGDGPEAVSAALQATLDADWRDDATKVAVLIADAPPHGLGESGDGFPNGVGPDPLHVLDAMSARGICVYSVGCQPALSRYRFATDFFVAAAERTNGQAVALASASALADVILGGAIEEMDLENLARDVQAQVQQMRAEEPELDDEVYVQRVYAGLAAKGQRTRQLKSKKLASKNAALVSCAGSLAAAQTALRGAAIDDAGEYDDDEYGCELDGDLHYMCEDAPSAPLSAPVYRSSLAACAASPTVRAAVARARPRKKKCAAPLAKSGSYLSADDKAGAGPGGPTIEEDDVTYEQVARLFSRGKKVGKW